MRLSVRFGVPIPQRDRPRAQPTKPMPWATAARGNSSRRPPRRGLLTTRHPKACSPDVYSGDIQQTLDNFYNQLDLIFQTKPLTYSLDKDKCVYAAGHFAGILSQEWNAKAQRIDSNPDREYSYDDFKAFLQEHWLPAHIRTANLTVKIAIVRQRPNQSVPQLIAYLNEFENQIDPPYSDRTRRDHLFVAIHEHICQTIVEQNRPWPIRSELEQVATSLEAAIVPSNGIKIKKRYTPLTMTTTGRTSARPAPRGKDRGRPAPRPVPAVSTRQRKPKQQGVPNSNPLKAPKTASRTTPNTTPRAIMPPPRTSTSDRSGYEGYNCHQRGHISKDCRQPKTGSGKVRSQ